MGTKKNIKILLTNVGRRTYFVNFLIDLIKENYPIEIHLSDTSLFTAAMHVSDLTKNHILPSVQHNPSIYLNELVRLVEKYKINCILPLSDLDPFLLSKNNSRFTDLDCKLILSSQEVISICDDKLKTYNFCKKYNLPTPEIYLNANKYTGPFPVIQKHIFGSGSSGLKIITSKEQLYDFKDGADMLQSYISGEEFGMDILNSFDCKYLSSTVKKKLLMRSGETDKAQVIVDKNLDKLAYDISESLGHIGNLDCDILKGDDGLYYCIDFNPRFGGGYPFTHLAGNNYLKAIFDMLLGSTPNFQSSPKTIISFKGISIHSF